MQVFSGAVEARAALIDFINNRTAALPEDVRTGLEAAVKEPSAVRSCEVAAELCYARRDDLPPEMLGLAAGIAVMMETHGFHGKAVAYRGSRMALAMRGHDVAELPEPLAEYLPPV